MRAHAEVMVVKTRKMLWAVLAIVELIVMAGVAAFDVFSFVFDVDLIVIYLHSPHHLFEWR